MFLGNSAGAAIKGVLQLKEHFTKEDVVVVLCVIRDTSNKTKL